MSSPRREENGAARPEGQADSSGRWIALEDAAVALHLSQQTLWHRLVELHLDVRRIDVGGRHVSSLSSADLERLAARGGGERNGSNGKQATPAAAAAVANAAHTLPHDASPTPHNDHGEHAARIADVDSAQRSLWQRLREFELQRDQLEFELRIVRTQLSDTRGRAQHAEESLRVLRADLDVARSEAERWRAQCEALNAERAGMHSMRAAERERLTVMERQMSKLIEIEKARERYCDRLEQRLRGSDAA